MMSPRAAHWVFAIFLCGLLGSGPAVSETATKDASLVAPAPQVVQAPAETASPEPAARDYTRLLDYSEKCPVGLPDWATESERFAWRMICAGRVADMGQFTPAVQMSLDQPLALGPSSTADTSADGSGCKALPKANEQAQIWPDSRRLSARFIKLVATRKPYVEVPAVPTIVIRCARIDDQIYLYHEDLPRQLVLQDSRIMGGMNVQGARFDSDLVLDGSDLGGSYFYGDGLEAENLIFRSGRAGVVELTSANIRGKVALSGTLIGMLPDPKTPDERGGLIATGLQVGQNLMLDPSDNIQADLQKVDLRSVRIGGDLSADSARVRTKMNLNGADIGGALFMRFGAEAREVDLISARMEKGLELTGLRVLKPADFSTISVNAGTVDSGMWAQTGSIWAARLVVNDSAFFNGLQVEGKLMLDEASISGPLYLGGSRIVDQLSANGLHVEGPISMGWNADMTAVSFRGAFVEGAVQLSASRFDGPFDLRNAHLGALELWDNGQDVSWGPHASLDLRNADIGVLQARFPQNWELTGLHDQQGVPLRLPVELENLRYDRLGSATPPQSSLPPELDIDNLIQWVSDSLPKSDQGQAAGFIPQPFRQLEETLRSMGADSEADEVQVAGHVHQIKAYSADLSGWLKTLAGVIWWALVGFGAYPFRVLWWFAALVGLGVLVSRWSPILRDKGWTDCFWYSLENAFPLLQPSSEHQKVIHDHPFLQNFFHFQKVAGFVLATILVGALTLLGG